MKVHKVIYTTVTNDGKNGQEDPPVEGKPKKLKKKQVIFQKDYLKEAEINKLLMLGP